MASDMESYRTLPFLYVRICVIETDGTITEMSLDVTNEQKETNKSKKIHFSLSKLTIAR